MNVKDSYIHGSDTLIKNLVFENHDNKRCLKITWALEGKNDTWIEVGTVDGLSTSVTKNFVYAGPDGSSGHTANAAPTFRKLVAADIPSLTKDKISNFGSYFTGISNTDDTTNHANQVKFTVGGASTTPVYYTIPYATKASSADNATNAAKVAIGTKNDNVNYYLPFVSNTSGNLPLYVDNTNTGTLTYNPSTGTVAATKFSGALSGNATTASNLNTALRGYLYQTANTTTLGTGTVATTSGKIGVPILFYGSQVNYTLNLNLFYATVTNNAITANTIYLDDNIKSKTFVKASNTAPSGVTSTTVLGSSSGGNTGVIYTAGNGINISGSTISTNTWTGTESQFQQLSNPSSYDVIYIIED